MKMVWVMSEIMALDRLTVATRTPDMIRLAKVSTEFEIMRSNTFNFISAFCVSYFLSVSALGATTAIAPDTTFGNNGFARVTIPTQYARAPIATHVYADGSVLSWTTDQSTNSHVVSWLAAPGSNVETTRARVTLDGLFGGAFNGAAIAERSAGALGFFFSISTPTTTENHCQRVSSSGNKEPSIAIEKGFISGLRDNRILVRGKEAVFRYNADCTLDLTYGESGKAALTIYLQNPVYVVHGSGEITIIENDARLGSPYKVRIIERNGALRPGQTSLTKGLIEYALFRGADDGMVWGIRENQTSCWIDRFDPRLGSPSEVSFSCPKGYSVLNLVYARDVYNSSYGPYGNEGSEWFGFLEDGRTPLLVNGERAYKNGRSTIHRLDLATKLWRSAPIPYTTPAGTPSVRAQSVIHRAASDEYVVTSMVNEFDFGQMEKREPLKTQIRTLVTRLKADFSPATLNFAIQDAISKKLQIPFETMEMTADKRLTQFVSVNDGIGIKGVVASFELSGSPRSLFGENGVVSVPQLDNCTGDDGTVATDALGTVTIIQFGHYGGDCAFRVDFAWQLDVSGKIIDAPSGRAFGLFLSHPPGVALNELGRPVFASITASAPSTGTVIGFYRVGLDDIFNPSSTWETSLDFPEASPRTILRALPDGGFVAAYVGKQGLKLFRLDAEVKPLPSVISSTFADPFFVPAPGSKKLLAFKVLADGGMAAVISTSNAIRTYYFNDKGLSGSQTVADAGIAQWVAGVHANGDTVAATEGADGKVRIVRSRRANLALSAGLVNDVWEWTTGVNFVDVLGLAVHPTEEYAYLSVSLQKNALRTWRTTVRS
jgi:hypothetical protein